MKLKDDPKSPPKHLWVLIGRQGRNRTIKFPDMNQAVIVGVEISRDRTGVVIHAEHPDTPERTGTTILSMGDKRLASNLLQTAQKFREKTFEELEAAEVTYEMSLTS
jgi:hypothetical protein